ncbi:phenylacetate--CoA ligase family protein [Notoacmeibacter sp. MSK16QG-6]|uniref:phenylacetate--CoA ligase family protein n=1 Tax=Notoacmeibacter sp. MSK16QG-6 TaxID=2957982 RepID=UPI00209D1308|nr:AMP-binding protein [Notoacmeibacter sp. MSK16QG-6]MCP1200274.1 AMP-binding protein [Notoacmeibacter sp. MSK16QG-6]
MSNFFDALETRTETDRESDLFSALRNQIGHARANALYYRRTLADIDPDAIRDRRALGELPILRKSDLPALQAENPPLGGIATQDATKFRRLFLSPGPIIEPEADEEHWRMGRALHAAGIGAGDRVLNAFAYHLTPAGFMFDHGCAAVGASVFPGGVGNTDQQAEAIAKLGLTAYVGTPDFLKTILERADENGLDTSVLTRALVTGGPLFPNLREWYAARGITVRQCYGTAELGLIAYESAGPADGMMVDENALVEIVRPGTGDPVAPGEVGEVVVTTFNRLYPLIRFATGDLSAFMTGASPCGRTAPRLKGWMGRADQTTKVRGMFVHPAQVARIIAPYKSIDRARLIVTEQEGHDMLTLHVEAEGEPNGLAERLAEALRAECRLRGDVVFDSPGTLPNDGKVVDDRRQLGV